MNREHKLSKTIVSTFTFWLFACHWLCLGNEKTVIFDMGDVLFEPKKLRFAHEIGIRKFMRYTFKGNNPHKVTDLVFEVMYSMGKQQPTENTPIAMYKNRELPAIMCDWMTGAKGNQQVLDEVLEQIEILDEEKFFSSALEKRLVKKVVKVMFSPEILIKHTKRIRPGFRLAKQVKKAGNKVIILSNWDKESFKLLKRKYQDFFEQYVDAIIISGDDHIQTLKPDENIYQKVLALYDLDGKNCVFIDDQKENIEAAKKNNILGIHCQNKKYDRVRKKLKKLGILN